MKPSHAKRKKISFEKYLCRENIPLGVRKVIQRELLRYRDVEEVLRRHIQMIDFANDTIMIRNLKDKITYWNQGAQRLYGWSKEEAFGKYVHRFLKTVFPIPLNQVLKICLRKGHWEGELKHTRRDGSKIIVSSRWTLQRDEQGKPVAFLEINNDITRLKKAEEALQEAHDQLEKRIEERTTELKVMNQALQHLIEERKQLEKEIIGISNLEQKRIGHDLHDGLSQHLTGIALMGKVLERKLERKKLRESVEVKKIVYHVNEAIAETRALARGLDPVELESNGLMSALQELAENTERLFPFSCKFISQVPVLIHNYSLALQLYRIAQEAVNNAVKHAQAKNIWIRLDLRKNTLLLEVKDDGRGIHKKVIRSKGMGLRIMRYRTEMIQASLDIRKGVIGGTVVICTVSMGKGENA